MKQELFMIRQNYADSNEKLRKMESMINNLQETLSKKTTESEEVYLNTKVEPKVPQPKIQKFESYHPINQGDKEEKVQNILFVGDSIAGNIHLPSIERAVNADVKLVKAYSSTYETTSNAAHRAPKFPDKNFGDVITQEMNNYTDALIIQSGSVDITNLKTETPDANAYLEYFKQKTIISSENIFQAALNAEARYPKLKKIIILKQVPRYDSSSSSPPGLKPYLSNLFNENIDKLCKSTQSSKIIIGNHNLECHGGVFQARYRNTLANRFDGVHLYGPSGMKAYTASVLNILSSAKLVVRTPPKYYDQFPHARCPQAKYQATQTRRYRQEKSTLNTQYSRYSQYSVSTQNKFDGLADWSQGNY